MRASERTEHGERFRLPADARVAFSVENLDDRLRLTIDGREFLALDIEANEHGEASLTIGVSGAGADVTELRVARDIYYLTREERSSWEVTIPPGSYVMLGDNTQDSADSRLWDSKTYTLSGNDGSPIEAKGNFRIGENPVFARVKGGGNQVRFRDTFGEVHWIPRSAPPDMLGGRNEPLVARELILGRALAVFWPINPFRGLWRVGWLH